MHPFEIVIFALVYNLHQFYKIRFETGTTNGKNTFLVVLVIV